MTGQMFAYGACYACGSLFTFNPELVPSVHVDPKTGRPPDVDSDGNPRAYTAAEEARSVREPICSACIGLVNAKRAAMGNPPIAVLPGAYQASETL